MKLVIRKSKIPGAGKGLFTTEPIKKGEKIVEYTGENITWAECKKRNELLEGFGAYYFYVSERKCVDAQNSPDAMARYANDAAGLMRIPGIRNNSNYAVIEGKPYIVASRNIKPGEEIFVSYGRDYWKVIRENGYNTTIKGEKGKPKSLEWISKNAFKC